MSIPSSTRAGEDAVVVLASGGLDSCMLLHEAIHAHGRVHPLYVRQGMLWEAEELDALQKIVTAMGGARLTPLTIQHVDPAPELLQGWAFNPAAPAPDRNTGDGAVFLPGRNLVLCSQAAILAYTRSISTIELGLVNDGIFPDSRRDTLNRLQAVFSELLNWPLFIRTPLLGRDKAKLIREHAAVPLEHSFSCLRPVAGLHCGACNKCAERRHAFQAAGLSDPTKYVTQSRTAAG